MLVYIASPYSGSSKEMLTRFYLAQRWTSKIIQQGIHAVSPIVHCHELARLEDLPTDAAFWADYNTSLFNASDAMIVLMFPGWEESKGVQVEIEWARKNKKPLYFIETHSDVQGFGELSMKNICAQIKADRADQASPEPVHQTG